MVNEAGTGSLSVKAVALSLREYSGINGVQQILREPGL
jgi:hypothetical protein